MVFLGLLVLSMVADFSKEHFLQNGTIERDIIGGEAIEVELELNIEDGKEDYTYLLEVLPMIPTKEEAEKYFADTVTLIEQDFAEVGEKVPLKKSYLDGAVRADWSFQPYGLIDAEGTIYVEKLKEMETIVQAQVELQSGAYEEIYEFAFLLKKPMLSKEEEILQKIDTWMEQQMEKEGENSIYLPIEVEGAALRWSEKKEYVTPQIIMLEMVGIVLFVLLSKRKQVAEERKRVAEMEWDYSGLVSQLSLLLGAGMTTRQAWNRIGDQYSFKRKSNLQSQRLVYEAILRMNRRLTEGETERVAYQKFSEEIPAGCYRKLMRILLGNLEMGTQGISLRLEEESRQAFEQKILQAKKRGEEISTKMLVPLMGMLLIVMGIIMLPALMQFQI